jgi:ABC-type glycerol-3-phosphate transport system substrate-binding protein
MAHLNQVRGQNMAYYLTLIALWLTVLSTAYAQTDVSSLAANAKQEKQVVWYTTTSAGDNQAIVAGFTKKYPFLKVEVLRSTGEKLRQRILTEASAGQFFSDVASVSSMEMGLLKSKNLLQAYDPPEAAGYPAATKDKEKYFTAIYARYFGLQHSDDSGKGSPERLVGPPRPKMERAIRHG